MRWQLVDRPSIDISRLEDGNGSAKETTIHRQAHRQHSMQTKCTYLFTGTCWKTSSTTTTETNEEYAREKKRRMNKQVGICAHNSLLRRIKLMRSVEKEIKMSETNWKTRKKQCQALCALEVGSLDCWIQCEAGVRVARSQNRNLSLSEPKCTEKNSRIACAVARRSWLSLWHWCSQRDIHQQTVNYTLNNGTHNTHTHLARESTTNAY